MPTIINLFSESDFCETRPAFWRRIANDESLATCGALEKLVTGCEIIAALDDLDLLAA